MALWLHSPWQLHHLCWEFDLAQICTGPNILQRCVVKVMNGWIICIHIPSLILQCGYVFAPVISWYVLGTIHGCPFFQGIVSSNKTSIFPVSSTVRGSTPRRAPMAYPPQSIPRNWAPKFALLSLVAELPLIQCIWGFHDAASMSLAMGYKIFHDRAWVLRKSFLVQKLSFLRTHNRWDVV